MAFFVELLISYRPFFSQDNEFDWDEKTQGLILSAFYWGYVIMHIPGGLLAQKFGGKHTLGFGILSTAIFTLLTPFAARQSANWLIALRFFEGLGEVRRSKALWKSICWCWGFDAMGVV